MRFPLLAFAAVSLLVAVFAILRPKAAKLRIRRLLSASARLLLRLRARNYLLSGQPVALVLAPHQDDDVLGCGGLIAGKRAAGQAVTVAFVTDGAASHRGHPLVLPAELAATRATEARAGLRSLGVDDAAIRFLGAPDGELARLAEEPAQRLTGALTRLLQELKPDEVFLPFRKDGSSEHEAAFHFFAGALAASGLRPRIYEFPVWSWWNPRLLGRAMFTARVVRFRSPGQGDRKARAIAFHRTQILPLPPQAEPVLSAEFVSFFTQDEEFFFES